MLGLREHVAGVVRQRHLVVTLERRRTDVRLVVAGTVSGVPLIANSGFGVQTTREEALRLLEQDLAEAVGVGRSVIANPDLALRWEQGLEENEPDPSTFYIGGERGYTDYPALRN